MRYFLILVLIFTIFGFTFAGNKNVKPKEIMPKKGSYEYYLSMANGKDDFASFIIKNYNDLVLKSSDFYLEKYLASGFVSYCIRKYYNFDIDAKINDGYEGSITKEDTLIYSIFKNGFSLAHDEGMLKRGDICFTKNRNGNGKTGVPFLFGENINYFPQNVYIFIDWVYDGKKGDAVVADYKGIKIININEDKTGDINWAFFHYDKNNLETAQEIISKYNEIEAEREKEEFNKRIKALIKENEEKNRAENDKIKEQIKTRAEITTTNSIIKNDIVESNKTNEKREETKKRSSQNIFEIDIGGGVDYYIWKEYLNDSGKEKEVVSETGPMTRLIIGISTIKTNENIFTISGEIKTAALNYNGQNQTGWPLATRTDIFGFSIDGEYKRKIIKDILGNIDLEGFINTGVDIWSRNIASNTVTEPGNPSNTQVTSGYIEKYTLYKVGAGVGAVMKIKDDKILINTGINYPVAVNEKVEFSKLGYKDFILNPKGDFSPFINVAYLSEKGIIFKLHCSTVFLAPSKLVEVQEGASYGQPKSFRLNTGLSIGYSFR